MARTGRRTWRQRLAIGLASGVAVVTTLMWAVPTLAHHSFATQYDASKPVEMRGTVTKVEWTNPHARFYIDVKDDKGVVSNWNFEMASPNVLVRNGWKRDTLKIGDQVTVGGYLARSNNRMAIAGAITDAGGRPLFASASADLARYPHSGARRSAMRFRHGALGVAAALVAAASLDAQIRVPTTLPPTARAGGNITTVPPKGPVPRQANGRPDLTGLWLRRGGIADIRQGLPKGETMPLLPDTLKRMQALLAKEAPQLNCPPLATPRANPYPYRLVETRTHLDMINESMHGYRQVLMDGRKHPPADELQPWWHGHSIGSWEGDTLVIDTVGFNDLTWFDNYGHLSGGVTV